MMAWEVAAALKKMKKGKKRENITLTLKAGDETIGKELATLYTKCITERRFPKTWKEAFNMVIVCKRGTETIPIIQIN